MISCPCHVQQQSVRRLMIVDYVYYIGYYGGGGGGNIEVAIYGGGGENGIHDLTIDALICLTK